MELEELKEKYKNVPSELKSLRRWVCYKIEEREGNKTKTPINALNGRYAKVSNDTTWVRFETALTGCIKYNCLGLGFVLGDGIFGVDLDNHPDVNGVVTPKEEFNELAKEFIEGLNSYTEYSQSGEGIHIICYGTLPQGRRRKGNVEMYDSGRFFAFTGNCINKIPLQEREKEIMPLWEKYVDDSKDNKGYYPIIDTANYKYSFLNYNPNFKTEVELSDDEIINKAMNSKNGAEFANLFRGGMPSSGTDRSHSAADLALCSMLAFWCNGDKDKIDRIFRKSGLMREKWNQKRGNDTYGNITINTAVRSMSSGYVNLVSNNVEFSNNKIYKEKGCEDIEMNIDENGEPIFHIKRVLNHYPYNDTGNALRFYDYFGDVFKYNKTDKVFMFWTGKTWVKDDKDIIRKYANKMIEIFKDEIKQLETKEAELKKQGEVDEAASIEKIIKVAEKNVGRFANKAGKDAMLSEFQSIKDVAATNDEFDKNPYLLNTDSGVVDLKTGDISSFNPKYMLSRNTNTKVSFEEPTTWINFLHSVFKRDNEQETQEIVECIQKCIGYSLSGSVSEQCMFILYGTGSNGKSTFSEQVIKILGDYGCSTPSTTLIQPKNGMNSNVLSSIAKLKGTRYVEMGETDEGERLAEATIKRLTGGDTVSARFLYGQEFDYKPTYKIWMATNNKPVIRGNDLGIWRRIFPFPFLRSFTDKEKDRTLPARLSSESDKILGWAIRGFQKYFKEGEIFMPNCLKAEVAKYKEQMDVISQFLRKQCVCIADYKTPCRSLYQNYKMWAKDSTEYIMREGKFEEELKNKGFKSIVYNGVPHFLGVKMNSDNTTAYVFNNLPEEAYR